MYSVGRPRGTSKIQEVLELWWCRQARSHSGWVKPVGVIRRWPKILREIIQGASIHTSLQVLPIRMVGGYNMAPPKTFITFNAGFACKPQVG